MKIYVNVRQAGGRRNQLTKQELSLNNQPSTLRELITEIVSESVNKFNQEKNGEKILKFLTSEEIENQLTVGKVSFGERYNSSQANLEHALETAFLAYEDGIFRAFIGEKEAVFLDEPMDIKEEDVITFIRFTMLSGRMW